MNNYKLIYERDGKIFGSLCGIPALDDALVPELNELFGIKLPEFQAEINIDNVEDKPKKSVKSKSKKSEPIVESVEIIESPVIEPETAEEINNENMSSAEIAE